MKPLAPLADIAVALKLQANDMADRTKDAEITAARIGLSPCVSAHLISERRRQAELIGDAYHLIRALLAIENTLLAVVQQSGETT